MALSSTMNVTTSGVAGAQPIVFAHGFGCGQHMWRLVAPAFEVDHQVVLLDLVGSGESDHTAYDPERYESLTGYADDIVGLCDELGLQDVVFVGHSVSAMIGVVAQVARPDLFAALVLVAPSARYLDDADGYVGGLSPGDVEDLLALMDSNHLGWQAPVAGLVAAAPDGSVRAELEESFCRTDPEIARHFAAVTFRGDNRADLPSVSVPTLVLQSRVDTIAPVTAGAFVADSIADARLEIIETVGHCPHLSAPDETVALVREFLRPA